MRIALFGAGMHARTHADAYQRLSRRTDVQVALVIDPAEERGQTLAASLSAHWIPRAQVSDLLGIDAADICTPTHLHREVALQCAEARLPALIDKPLAPTLAEADQIIEAFTSAAVNLTPGLSTRHVPALAQLARAAAEGQFGRVELVQISHTQGYAWPNGWRAWQQSATYSGGRIVHLGVHDLDYACWLIGTPPRTVRAIGQPLAGTRSQAWASAVVQIGFDSALALISFAWEGRPASLWRKRCLVVGSLGTGSHDSRLDEGVYTDTVADPVGYRESLEAEIAKWLETIRSGGVHDDLLLEARTSLQVAEAAAISAESDGRVVVVGQ